MLSKRIYFTISCIMLLLLFMFQASGIIRKDNNSYDNNSYADTEQTDLTRNNVYTVSQSEQEVLEADKRYVVYIGNTKDNRVGSTVYQWCNYTKRNLLSYQSVQDYNTYKRRMPEAVLIDSAYMDYERDMPVLQEIMAEGIHLVFCTLPGFQEISENEQLRDMLGIMLAVSDDLQVSGIKLYNGFLLGGETWYIVNETSQARYQDMDLRMPWYVLDGGTKTYMSGVLEVEEYETVKNEDLPAIMWRRSTGQSYNFAVNGAYFDDCSGFGILSSIMYELNDYEVYPVVNAQSVIIKNYPVFAYEHEEDMEKYYSRNMSAVLRNIVWPDISNLATNTGAKLTFMITPQFDYTDKNEPSSQEMEYFFRLFNEKGFEAGLSTYRNLQTTLSEKFETDRRFFRTFLGNYKFVSLYARSGEIIQLQSENLSLLEHVRTIVTDDALSSINELFSYADEDTLQIKSLISAAGYSFKRDFMQKSLDTSLAYANIRLDLTTTAAPVSVAQLWDRTYKNAATALSSYLSRHKYFNSCTVSEADKRIRKFLALDYEFHKVNNTLEIDIKNFDESADFMLRFHNQEIAEISGGSYQEIEEGSYLLTANSSNVTVTVKDKK